VYRQLRVPNRDLKYKDAVPTLTVRRGDIVRVRAGQGVSGDYVDKDTKVKDVEGKVSRVDYKRQLLYIEDLKIRKRGNKVADRPIEPQNVWVIKLDLTDAKRREWLDGERNKTKE
jgi:ribosomal protein uL24